MNTLLQDVRYAARMLRRSPGFTAIAVLCLGLGIGINTTIYSAFNAMFARPLPFPEPDRLVSLTEHVQPAGYVWNEVSPSNFTDWTQGNPTLESAAVYDQRTMNLSGEGEVPENVQGAAVSPALFRTLGVRPVVGRDFRDEEGVEGADRVAVISHDLWQRRFDG
ncbi:MAG TPA: ABC transporter permease, partial [Longimicrobiaceae bacterium]|nr:ABC transporter permease [Longimicrobiaceae bacterium]